MMNHKLIARHVRHVSASSQARLASTSSVWETLGYLISRDGSKEFKKLHQSQVLNTPSLSAFPASLLVFHELRTRTKDLAAAGFDAEDFLAGAKQAYPVVHDLMLNMDPEEEDTIASPASAHTGSRKDNNRRLRGLLGANLYTAAKQSMGQAKSAGQSWKVEELEVEKAWIQDLLVDGGEGDAIEGGGEGGGEGDAAATLAAPASDTVLLNAKVRMHAVLLCGSVVLFPRASHLFRTPFVLTPRAPRASSPQVGFIVREKYVVELDSMPGTPMTQARTATHYWTLERRVKGTQAQPQAGDAAIKVAGDKDSGGDGGAAKAEATAALATTVPPHVEVEVSLPLPMGITLEEVTAEETAGEAGAEVSAVGEAGIGEAGWYSARVASVGGAAAGLVRAGDAVSRVGGACVAGVAFDGVLARIRAQAAGTEEGAEAGAPEQRTETGAADASAADGAANASAVDAGAADTGRIVSLTLRRAPECAAGGAEGTAQQVEEDDGEGWRVMHIA